MIDRNALHRRLVIGAGAALVMAALVGVACENTRHSPSAPGGAAASQAIANQTAPGSLAAAANAKVTLCHVNGNDEYNLISVSTNAEPAHRAHGDRAPGEPVPGNDSLAFGSTCELVLVPPPPPPPPACTTFTDQASCEARTDCRAVIAGANCHRPDGTTCQMGDLNCICEPPFTFQACVAR